MGRSKIRASWHPVRLQPSLYGSVDCREAISRAGWSGHVSEQHPEVARGAEPPRRGSNTNLCATTPATLPTMELKLGQISDAVAGSTDMVFSFEELVLLPYFVGSLPFETADKETSYKIF